MIIRVIVKTFAKEESIEKIGDSEYRVNLKAKPINNKANNALIKLLSNYFEVKKEFILIKNKTSKKKLIEIKEQRS